MEEKCQYGIRKNRLSFHTMPCQQAQTVHASCFIDHNLFANIFLPVYARKKVKT